MQATRAGFARLAALTALVSLALVPQAAAQGVRLLRSEYSVGRLPQGAAVADFNHDGFLDLAVPSGFPGSVSVLLGNGDGTFRAPVAFAASSPVSIVAADFNRDGNVDLAVGHASASTFSVTVHMGAGDGTFQSAIATPVATSPTSVVAADFNGDGFADLALGNENDQTQWVLVGQGDGTFRPAQALPSSGGAAGQILAADLNRDGIVDLVTTSTNAWNTFAGRGDGTFGPPIHYATFVRNAAVADFNGDGMPDVVTAYPTNAVQLYLNEGDGTFTSGRAFALPQNQDPTDVAAGDFDGDGKADVLINAGATIRVLRGDGAGALGSEQAVGVAAGPPVAGDFNRDGLIDLAETMMDAQQNVGIVSVYTNATRGAILGGTATWTDIANTTASGGTVRKTGGCSTCFDAAAVASQTIAGDRDYADVAFVASDATLLRVVGLAHAFSGLDPNTIDFAFRFQDGTAEVRERGVYRGETPAAAGDAFRIEIEGGVVRYFKDNALIYVSATAPVYPLAFAAAFANTDADASSATIVGDPPGGCGSDCGGGGGGAPVTWTDGTNVTVDDASIGKTGGCDGCFDASARSSQELTGDGAVDFTVDDPAPLFDAGLTHTFDTDPGTIDFGWRVQGGYAEVVENGEYRTDVVCAAGDVLRVSVENGVVSYSTQGQVIYMSAAVPQPPLFFAVTFANAGASISNVTVTAAP